MTSTSWSEYIPDPDEPERAGPTWADLVEDGADLQTKTLPPIVQIVEDILPEQSKLSIVSSAKCFKTWLTIYLGLAIAQGADFLDRHTARRKVLYVNLELKPQTFTRRLQAVARELRITIDPKWFFHLSLRGRLTGLTVAEIVTRIIVISKKFEATVVVIDPLFKLNIEGEENSSRDQTRFCNELDRLTTEGACTAIFNDHSGKGNQSEKDPLDVIRGSSAKGGDLDAAMVLRKHENEQCFRVDLVHRELPPVAPFVIGWEYPLMRVRPDLSPDDMKKVQAGRKRLYKPEQLLKAIKDTTAENPISISAWAECLEMSRQTLQNYLPELRLKNLISTVGEGNNARKYITEKGRELLKDEG
jgi:hypothetical protein